MEKDAIIGKGLRLQEIEWDQFEFADLVAVQREVRTAIDAKRKLAGRERLAETGATSPRVLPQPLYYGTEYANHPDFAPYLDNVRAHYGKDAAFQQLVHEFAGKYLERTARSVGRGAPPPQVSADNGSLVSI